MKVDLHVHTRYSPDSLTSPLAVARWAWRAGLDAVAVTDHNAIAGALAAQAAGEVMVIVGEEVRAIEGEVIGLFLHEAVPAGLSARESAPRSRAQGGVVYIPHPFDRLRHSALRQEALEALLPAIDAVEALNARVLRPDDNARARAWADEHALACGAGSDAHHGVEIGHAYVEMPAFHDAASFLAALRLGTVEGGLSSPLCHLSSVWARVAKGLFGAG